MKKREARKSIRVSRFRVHVKLEQCFERSRCTAKVTLCHLRGSGRAGPGWIGTRRISRNSITDVAEITRGLLAVVIRAAVVTVPWKVRIIIRRVVSIIARLGRANSIIGVVSMAQPPSRSAKATATNQRKDRYNVPICFRLAVTRLGRSFDGRPFANAS